LLQFFIHLTKITAPLKLRLIRKVKRELWNTFLLSVIAVFLITMFVIPTQPGHDITYTPAKLINTPLHTLS